MSCMHMYRANMDATKKCTSVPRKAEKVVAACRPGPCRCRIVVQISHGNRLQLLALSGPQFVPSRRIYLHCTAVHVQQ